MRKWRRRTTFVRAQLVTEWNIKSLARHVGGVVHDDEIHVQFKGHTEVIGVGEYIVRAKEGGYFRCDPDYFEKMYEEASL